MPGVTGGPRTDLSGGPHDHELSKGDWLLDRKADDGRTIFGGYFDPSEPE